MSEMVERVKAAIREASVPHDDPLYPTRSLSYYASVGIDTFQHDHDRLEKLIQTAARAAIAAMREPTEAMAKAGHDEFAVCEFGVPLTRSCMTVPQDIFRTMVDAALGQEFRAAPESEA